MRKSDRLYLSQFTLDPDPEQVWLEEFDLDEDPEDFRMEREFIFGGEDDMLTGMEG